MQTAIGLRAAVICDSFTKDDKITEKKVITEKVIKRFFALNLSVLTL